MQARKNALRSMRDWVAVWVIATLYATIGSGPASASMESDETGDTHHHACNEFRLVVSPGNVTMKVGDVERLESRVVCDGQDVTNSTAITWGQVEIGKVEPAAGMTVWFKATSEGNGTLAVNASYGTNSAGSAVSIAVVGCGRPGTSLWRVEMWVEGSSSGQPIHTGQSVAFGAKAYDQTGSQANLGGGFSGADWWVGGRVGVLSNETYAGNRTARVIFTATQEGLGKLNVRAWDDTMQSACNSIRVSVQTGPPTFTLSGQVTGENGEPVKDVRVEIIEVATGAIVFTTTTDSAGRYSAVLQAGKEYRIRVTRPDGTRTESKTVYLNGDSVVDIRYGAGPFGLAQVALAGGGVVAAFGAAFAVLFFATESTRLAVLFLPVIMYSRLRRDKVLDHFVRGQVFGYIVDHPGTTYSEIRRSRHLANGVVAYHLYTLEREGFVKSVRDGTRRRYFEREAPISVAGVTLSELQTRILNLVGAKPGISQAEIASSLGTKRQNVSYNVRRLVDAGLMRMEGWGSKKKCFSLREAMSQSRVAQ